MSVHHSVAFDFRTDIFKSALKARARSKAIDEVILYDFADREFVQTAHLITLTDGTTTRVLKDRSGKLLAA